MTEIINEIVPETNKIYKTRINFSIENFLQKLNTVSRLDFDIPGLTSCHLEVHPNFRKEYQRTSTKFTKLVFRIDAPESTSSKARSVKFEMRASNTNIWFGEFEYSGSVEKVKEEFINQFYLKTTMQGDSLFIKGLIQVKEYDWSVANDSMLPGAGRYMKFVNDIRSLTSSGHLSDFTFVVQGRELEVHKAILSARSPVFERMFTGSFRESTARKQEILDISADIFEEFLYFIYAGELRNPDFSVEELIFVADRYGVSDLLNLCEMKLLRSINDDNAETIFRMANQIQCNPELKKVAFEVLQSNFKRFSMKLPSEFIDAPEKLYNVLETKKKLEEFLNVDETPLSMSNISVDIDEQVDTTETVETTRTNVSESSIWSQNSDVSLPSHRVACAEIIFSDSSAEEDEA